MGYYAKEYEQRQKKIREELDELMKNNSTEELQKRFFINFGCINFCSEELGHELSLARAFHDLQEKLHPEQHDKHYEEPYRCYCVTKCKCGYEEACDSSD